MDWIHNTIALTLSLPKYGAAYCLRVKLIYNDLNEVGWYKVEKNLN